MPECIERRDFSSYTHEFIHKELIDKFLHFQIFTHEAVVIYLLIRQKINISGRIKGAALPFILIYTPHESQKIKPLQLILLTVYRRFKMRKEFISKPGI